MLGSEKSVSRAVARAMRHEGVDVRTRFGGRHDRVGRWSDLHRVVLYIAVALTMTFVFPVPYDSAMRCPGAGGEGRGAGVVDGAAGSGGVGYLVAALQSALVATASNPRRWTVVSSPSRHADEVHVGRRLGCIRGRGVRPARRAGNVANLLFSRACIGSRICDANGARRDERRLGSPAADGAL